MHRSATPVQAVLPDGCGLGHVLDVWMEKDPERNLFSFRDDSGWRDVRYREFVSDVRAAARRLRSAGVQPGDRVIILGRTGYPWVVADFATLSVGAVSVPVYPTASEHQVRHVVADSGAVWAFAELSEQRQLLAAVGGAAFGAGVWSIGELSGVTGADTPGGGCPTDTDDAPPVPVRADDLATIVYTSGTTGLPKGCMLTHRNFFSASANVVEHTGTLFRGTPEEQASTVLFLPLSHVYGRTMLIACLWGGTRTRLVPGVQELAAQLAAFRPTFLAVVPYALEKLRKGLRTQAGDGLGARLYAAAERTAVEHGTLVSRGEAVPADLAAVHAAFDDAVYGAIRERFGGRLRHAICGGASLDASTAAFFPSVGLTILGGYGLTETATAVTVSAPATNRLGTVGCPIPGVAVAIADDGEVLVSGPNVTGGYWPDLPADMLEKDGESWLRTGDLGRLDADGYLAIEGRRKEILITSGGKNVAPAPLEDRIRLHPLVSNAIVVGEGRPFVAALITLDEAAVRAWATAHGRGADPQTWSIDPDLRAEIALAVADANALVSRAESVREFRLVAGDFTVDRGLLTPSLKLRRAQIADAYAADLTALYGAVPTAAG